MQDSSANQSRINKIKLLICLISVYNKMSVENDRKKSCILKNLQFRRIFAQVLYTLPLITLLLADCNRNWIDLDKIKVICSIWANFKLGGGGLSRWSGMDNFLSAVICSGSV